MENKKWNESEIKIYKYQANFQNIDKFVYSKMSRHIDLCGDWSQIKIRKLICYHMNHVYSIQSRNKYTHYVEDMKESRNSNSSLLFINKILIIDSQTFNYFL